MAERTTVTQVVQLGTEVTPGTAVAANRKLPSLTIEPGVKTSIDAFRPLGNKFTTIHAQGKEWAEAKISGAPTYSEIEYLLASLLAYAAPVQQGATTAYKWTHAPSSTAEDTIKTYTVERGSAVRADKVAYGLVAEFGLKGTRESVELEGMMLSRQLQDNIVLTGSPTVIEQIPILAKEIDVYLDTTSGGIGTTKLARLLSWELTIKNRFSPLWVVDSAQASWVAHVETPVDAKLKLLVEADASGMGLLTPVRDNTTRFVRIKGTSGKEAGTAIPYSLAVDLAVQSSNVDDFSDEDGVYAIAYEFELVHDAGWGKAMTVDVINKQSVI